MHGRRYCSAFIITLAVCFVTQTILLHASGGRTRKGESNYFSSIARLQTGIAPLPRMMLLGSSMTGRLPDRAAGWEGVANLGCDAGSAVTALRAIARGAFPVPEAVVVEANTLVMGMRAKPGEIDQSIGSAWFWAGVHVPQVGATARPAAIAYSALLVSRTGSFGQKAARVSGTVARPMPWPREEPLSAEDERLATELIDLLVQVRNRGARLMLAELPCRRADKADWIAIVRQVSRRADCALVDLTAQLPSEAIAFTDDVHLDAASAALCLESLMQSFASLQ